MFPDFDALGIAEAAGVLALKAEGQGFRVLGPELAVLFEIFEGETAAKVFGYLDDGFGDLALVETGFAFFGQGPEGLCECRVLEEFSIFWSSFAVLQHLCAIGRRLL